MGNREGSSSGEKDKGEKLGRVTKEKFVPLSPFI